MRKFAFPMFLVALVVTVIGACLLIRYRHALRDEAIEAVLAEYRDVEVAYPEARVIDDWSREVEVIFTYDYDVCTTIVVDGKVTSEFDCHG